MVRKKSAGASASFEWKTGQDPKAMTAKLLLLKSRSNENFRQAFTDVIEKITADARENAPYQYGLLQSSIANVIVTDSESIRAYIGSDLDYSLPQEFGTYKMSANAYLGPAIEANREWARKRFEQAIEDSGGI